MSLLFELFISNFNKAQLLVKSIPGDNNDIVGEDNFKNKLKLVFLNEQN